MTSGYHGSKIFRSQQSFLTETLFASLSDGRKVWATVLFLRAIMQRKIIHVNFFFLLAFFFLPRVVEIQNVCYHGSVT